MNSTEVFIVLFIGTGVPIYGYRRLKFGGRHFLGGGYMLRILSYGILLIFVVPSVASARVQCIKVDYAELQDMSTEEQIARLCKVQGDYAFNKSMLEMQDNVYGGNNRQFMDARHRRNEREWEEDRDACKAALDSVTRLLRRKNIDIETIQCPKGS